MITNWPLTIILPMKLSDEKIDSIAQEVDMGMEVYLHKKTGDTLVIPDQLNMDYAEPGAWDEEIQEVENHRDNYLLIEDMPSREAYRVMEEFVGQIEDETTHMVLDVVLNNAKPFRNFKNTLRRFPEVRQEWFKFKKERMKQWVINQIDTDGFTM